MQKLIDQLKHQYTNNLPFVGYRRPNDNLIKIAFQKDDALHIASNYTESGFVFAPFNNALQSILIPFTFTEEVFFEPKNRLKKNDKFPVNTSENTEKHQQLVQKGIDAIRIGVCEKIVLSRKQNVLNSTENPILLFERLLNTYATEFVYVWHHPKVGCWLGATPEVLLSTRGGIFKTMSLAGTQKHTAKLTWSIKEYDEQQLVTNFIIDCLKKENINCTVSEIYTIKTGDLAHLRTDISGKLSTNDLPKLIKALHPTPAVCGLPKQKAKTFIIETEDYDRQFYTGFLGELNLKTARKKNKNNTENKAYQFKTTTSSLYVNLRCMQYNKKEIIIYVGGGITKNSNPELEYQETVNKAETMLKVLF